MTYELEKNIWSGSDFEQMGWHDCRVYKIRLGEDLEMDIDYILQWNKPDLEGLPFTFWVAPATLVFKNIKNLTFEVDTGFADAVEIEDIERTQDINTNHWTIITQQGDLEFSCNDYEQFIRQEPFFEFEQTISFIERNGLSLDRTANQENSNRNREDILERRKKDLESYENAKKRHLKRQEKEQLDNARNNNEIETRQYILKKMRLNGCLITMTTGLKKQSLKIGNKTTGQFLLSQYWLLILDGASSPFINVPAARAIALVMVVR